MSDYQPRHQREGLSDPAADPQTRPESAADDPLADPQTDPAFVGDAPFDEERKDIEEGEAQSVPNPDELPGTVSDPQRDPLTEGMQENAGTSLDQPSDNTE